MDLKEFGDFLSSLNLKRYRELYKAIKIVEMDLDKNIQAIALMYKVYWEEKNIISFDEFYDRYKTDKSELIETFRKKIQMCEICFYKGLPARIYRTWTSIITQIHAGYVAESVFGTGTVYMSEYLDHKGTDFQVKYKNKILNYQVKKKSFSRERRIENIPKTRLAGEFINIDYEVPSEDYFENPKKKDGSFKLPYKRFIENKNLRRLENGFVVFTENIFINKKNEIDLK